MEDVRGTSHPSSHSQHPKDDALPLSGLMTKLIADAVGAGLLPPTFDGAVNARLSVRRVLRPRRRSATGGRTGRGLGRRQCPGGTTQLRTRRTTRSTRLRIPT